MTATVNAKQRTMESNTGTASALLLTLVLGIQSTSLNPAGHYIQQIDPEVPRYSGEGQFDNPYYSTVLAKDETERLANLQIASRFATNLLENIHDIEPEYAELVNDNFWDLI